MGKSRKLRQAERSVYRAIGDLATALGDISTSEDPELYERVRENRENARKVLADIQTRRERLNA